MHTLVKVALGAGVVLGLTSPARAQAPAPNPATHATLSDPEGPPPDRTHIPFVLPKDVKWTGDPARQQTAVLYGDQSKEGPYGVLIKWAPGAFSRPHFHDQTRWIDVVSGTWWVSSSNVYDEKTTYPFHAGTVSTDVGQHRALGRCAFGGEGTGRHSAHRRRPGEDYAGGRERKAARTGEQVIATADGVKVIERVAG